MDIGIFTWTNASIDPAVLAKRAEELGFESFWVPELPIVPVEANRDHIAPDYANRRNYGNVERAPTDIPPHRMLDPKAVVDPFVALARASAVTTTIKLGTGVCLVPEHNPLLLAKEVATLDQFSGGRFLFGIGAGGLREQQEIMGADFDHRWTQARDAMLAMKALWAEDEAEYHGTYYDFPAVYSFPKPAQTPHPPVFLGGTAKNVLKRVVDYGDGWMPARAATITAIDDPNFVDREEIERGRATLNELAEEAGRDPASIQVLAFGGAGQYRTREAIEALEEAGANRATIWLENHREDEALEEIEELASRVLV
jgi:probable F420-dependent oxidoreductase